MFRGDVRRCLDLFLRELDRANVQRVCKIDRIEIEPIPVGLDGFAHGNFGSQVRLSFDRDFQGHVLG